jgi:FemAB-related protein (PEP-CTERM system-associated)
MKATAHVTSIVSARGASLPVAVSTTVDAAEWDDFMSRHDGTIEHLWAWRGILSDVFGHRCEYLVARRGGSLVAALPLAFVKSLIFGRSVVSLPFANYAGIVSDDAEATYALVSRAGELGAAFGAKFVELRNINRHVASLPCRSHKVGSRLMLPASADELFSALDRKVRNQVRKAQKDRVEVIEGGQELLDQFYGIFARNMRDLGTPVFPRALFTETLRRFPANARVFVARHANIPIAAAIALTWNGIVLVPWASSIREFRRLNGNMLLYCKMMEFAIARGCRTFDFGRSSVGGTTLAFKEQWNATTFPLHWEYCLLKEERVPEIGPSSGHMQTFVEAWRRLPLVVANRIGPLVNRNLS